MNYEIDKDFLTEKIREEVSHIANVAYDDEGNSLYDGVLITSSDLPKVGRYIDDAVDAFTKRTFDICSQDGALLLFNVPDFDVTFTDSTVQEIDRFLILNSVAAWCQERIAGKVEEYANRSLVAMDKAVAYLKSRKAPVRHADSDL